MIGTVASFRLVGILGGMGPAATADFYAKLIELTPATVDQEHLPVVMWADPSVPSRQEALLSGGTDPTPWLVAGVDQLERCGAQIVVVPCNTVHGYLPAVMGPREVEFINIIDTTIDSLPAVDEGESIGLLATEGALASGVYQSVLTSAGYRVALPLAAEQATIMHLVHQVKAGIPRASLNAQLRAVTESLRDQGVGVAIAGCTELSTLLDGPGIPAGLRIIDPAVELARKTIVRSMTR